MSIKITEALGNLRTEYTLTKPLLIGDGNLKDLLDVSLVAGAQYGTIAQAFVQNQGINEAFWVDLQDNVGLDPAVVADLKVTVDLGVIAKNHLPTLQLLKETIDDQTQVEFNAPRDYAKLSQSEWVTFIQSGNRGIPANLADENTFAATLKEQAERLFPDVALVAEVGRHQEHGLAHVAAVAGLMDQLPEFNLARDDIDKFNVTNGNLLAGEALQEAKALQRIHRLSPSVAVGSALLDDRLHSSMQVYFKGKGRLVESLSDPGIAREDAYRVFRLAENQYATVLSTITQYRFDLVRESPSVVPNFTYTAEEIEEFKKDIPNLEVLFGSLDFCECEHCRSLYSPAAYLTDLLRFLEEKDAVPANQNVQDILFDRRPDIANIKLNCANTNTPLPYIDLVNEILENAIPPAAADFTYQSTLSAAELRAIPEYVRADAYRALRKATFPMSSTFNLWQEEARLFLQHLGVPRYKLMEVFQNRSDPNNKSPLDVDIAAEFFGISAQEQAILVPAVAENTAAKQNEYWGFATAQDARSLAALTTLSVADFLQRAKITYHQLLELLQVKFVNPDLNRSIINRPVDDCDVDQQTIDNLSLDKFEKIHRFLRLWRRTGWAMWELDLLIRNGLIGNGVLDDTCLVALRQFKELETRLSLPVESLLAFFGDINTEMRASADASARPIQPLYHRLFLNVSVTNPVDPDFKNLPLNDDPLADHQTTILSALAITEEEFSLLLAKTDGKLNLASLSALYRFVTLARKLRLPIKDFLLLLKITDASNPFSSIARTRDLIDHYDAVKSSGFSLAELDYVLNFAPESPIGLRTEVVVQYITALRTGLSNLQSDLLNSNDTRRLLLEKHLSKLPVFAPADTLAKALDLIEGIWPDDEPARLSFISTHFGTFIPAGANPGTVLSKENFFDGDQQTEIEEKAIATRYDYVLGHLYPFLNANLITEHIASVLNLSNQEADILLGRLSLPGQTVVLRVHLQDQALIERDKAGNFVREIDETNFPQIFQTYRLVHKNAVILDNFQLDPDELAWFITHDTAVETLALDTLPVAAPPAGSLFPAWLNWWKLLAFKAGFPEPEGVSFYDVLELGSDPTANLNTLLTKLATLTQWNLANLERLHTDLGFSLADYAKAQTYDRLRDCMRQIRRAGVDAESMLAWADRVDENRDEPIAQAIRQAAKARYEVAEWLRIVEPIQDVLREKKRDALIAYLIEHSLRNEPPMIVVDGKTIPNPLYREDANDLYAYCLIDVEMNACQLASRISQAISSTQLFVQRCFLNLESRFVKVPKDDPDLENNWNQWKWMKNYRIWEANRKVFFYPENWIEPELRDNKSPFFRDLENEILQKEITHENVEQAFLNYLQKVNEVARLEVVGLYHHIDGLKNEVHVIGRTRTVPHIYYHRIYDLQYFTWSPWERIEVDITGDHVIPVVYNRKLHLFWLVFEEKPIKIKKVPGAQAEGTGNGGLKINSADNPEPPRVLEIQLAWSIKKHDGWTAKAVSKEKLIHPWQRPHYSYHIRPRYKDSDNTLWIDLFISTSGPFNDGYFFDQFAQKKVQVTRNRFNETYLPWHSSSFVFDGDIVDVKLRGLIASYYDPGSGSLQVTSSYRYVHENFGPDGEMIKELLYIERGTKLTLPPGMHYEYNALTNNKRSAINNNVLNLVGTTTLLQRARNPFRAVIPMQNPVMRPFVYQDNERAFFVKSEWEEMLADYQTKVTVNRYVFYPLYHPYTALFIRELNRSGLDGLLNRKIQTQPATYTPKNTFDFTAVYGPVSPHDPAPTAQKDIVDFSFGGAYSIYNWELFFHAPMLIAGKLSQNQRFEEAMRWYHYIFDPTNTENLPVPQRYWITKPFYEHTAENYRAQRIQNLIDKIDEFRDQVMAWKNNPFQPHLIARYRPVAYQRNIVMKYIDNLIAWGDQLFRRDTMESINEASLLYMLAYELLGDRPEAVPAVSRSDKTFKELLAEGPLDILGNTKVEVAAENDLGLPVQVVPSIDGTEPLPRLETSYFCIPHNDKLLGYWDLVEDRLFKIRNCMNIEGLVRQLPLFAPPIDPALLVKAAAAGVDLGSVLNDLSVPNPIYRFRVLHQTAVRFCGEVKALGEKLLNVLESKDAEGLALLRSSHELRLQQAIKEVRKLQIEEAEENVTGLTASRDVVDKRIDYYAGIPYMNTWEALGAALHAGGIVSDIVATVLSTLAGTAHLIPKFEFGAEGFGGSPRVTAKFGGENVGNSSTDFAALFRSLAGILHASASLLETQGNYQRRAEENAFQKELAEMEKIQIQSQIASAQIRVSIAEREQANHELQVENTRSEDEYLRTKYTNQQLFSWMLTQVASVYFQAYQLAYDMAKRAEKSFRSELGLQDSAYIQFGYWDSLKKGLLAGDKLMHDLNRMETAYYDQHKRELELTKHVSLAQIAPWHLLQLKMTGECTVELPEWLFDMDYPGHYMRRIKSVSVTIPCVTGPYSGVHCTLSLHSSRIRISNLVGSSYEMSDMDDNRFRHQYGTIQSIATSHGQNDNGLFELNFTDERFLPFEGSGTIGTWGIRMPQANNLFDLNTISDVVLHIRYTARDGGGNLATAAQKNVNAVLPVSGVQLFSLKHQFATEWYRFLHPDQEGADQVFNMTLGREHFPFFARKATAITVTKLDFVLAGRHDGDYRMELESPGAAVEAFAVSPDPNLDGIHHTVHNTPASPNAEGEWHIKIRRDDDGDFKSLAVDDLEDVVVIVHFGTA